MIKFIKKILKKIYQFYLCKKYPNITKTSVVFPSVKVYNKKNLYMGESSRILDDAVIMNTRGKFILKKWSGAAIGLLVVTGNHMQIAGMRHIDITNKVKDKVDINHEYDKDIVVDEDVWLGSHVTLLSGSHVGRGCVVGSGTIVRGNIPPYAIVIGNPAKIVGFVFTPDEVKVHEEQLYHENDRIPLDKYKRDYEKYFIKNISNINQFIKIKC